MTIPPNLTCTFAGLTLDRADARRQQPDWIAAKLADADSLFLPYHELKPAMRLPTGPLEAPRPAWCDRAVVADALAAGQTAVFLGVDGDERAYFAVEAEAGEQDTQIKRMDVRSAAHQLSAVDLGDSDAAVIGLGRTLLDWHARHRFCAQCGAPSRLDKGGYARRCSADGCGAQHFPRVDPVVIMLPVAGDRCILGRQPRYPQGMYSALAGFLEAGEAIEEAVRRETSEEAGVATGAVRYVASQPWPFPSSLMIGCLVEALSEEIIADDDELEDVAWFTRDQVAAALAGRGDGFFVPPPMAIAHQLMRRWLEAT